VALVGALLAAGIAGAVTLRAREQHGEA
jgi:hypothetical protein